MLSAAVMGPNQFFTLDASCYYGCIETGAGNCEEICQAPSYSVGTMLPAPKSSNLQWWILGAVAVVALVVVSGN